MTAITPTVLSAAAMKGGHVTGSQGEDLGRIKEVMIDLSAGRVAYAVMSLGGFLGIGARMVAIPWEALHVSKRADEYFAEVSKDLLKKAPCLSKEQLPGGIDRTFLSGLYAYFGCEPYWGMDEAQAPLWSEVAETGEEIAEDTTTEYGALSEVGGFEGEDMTSGMAEPEPTGEAFGTTSDGSDRYADSTGANEALEPDRTTLAGNPEGQGGARAFGTEDEEQSASSGLAPGANAAGPAAASADDLNVLGSTLRLEGDDFEGEAKL